MRFRTLLSPRCSLLVAAAWHSLHLCCRFVLTVCHGLRSHGVTQHVDMDDDGFEPPSPSSAPIDHLGATAEQQLKRSAHPASSSTPLAVVEDRGSREHLNLEELNGLAPKMAGAGSHGLSGAMRPGGTAKARAKLKPKVRTSLRTHGSFRGSLRLSLFALQAKANKPALKPKARPGRPKGAASKAKGNQGPRGGKPASGKPAVPQAVPKRRGGGVASSGPASKRQKAAAGKEAAQPLPKRAIVTMPGISAPRVALT